MARPSAAALALLLTVAAALGPAAAVPQAVPGALDAAVRFDNRSFILNGERKLLLSGAVHYARILPEDWARVFKLAKAMGLNAIQTYFMWNFHEPVRGNLTWSGRRDLAAFVRAAEAEGLHVVLRVGPFVCGEYYFGGIPIWVRDSGLKCDKCSDPIWEAEMERIVGIAVDQVRPLLASNGGPIVMLQVENEYNGADQAYLDWAVDMANKATAGSSVPWILCHDHKQCAAVNRDASGAYAFKAICTINGFWMDEHTKNPAQPSPIWAAEQFANNPGQPLAWTEDQGWFDQWGVAQRVRESADQLYGIARHHAFGGSYHNHYMLTGGNNYGLQAGGQVVTAYAPDTAIDYLLLRKQPRYDYYAAFYKTLGALAGELLAHPVTTGRVLPSNATGGSGTAGLTSLLHCTDDDPAHMGVLDATQQWRFAPAGSRDAEGNAAGQLRSVSSAKMCLDSQVSHHPPKMTACADGKASQLWVLDTAATHVRSVAQGPCLARGASGMCHYCLDNGGGTSLQLWDCKSKGAASPSHQYFYLDAKESGIRANASAGNCVTYQASAGAGRVEVHEYGAAVFLSNTDTTEWLAASYGGARYVLRPQSVQIVNGTTGAVLYDTGAAVDPPIPQRGVGAHVRTRAPQTTAWRVHAEDAGAGLHTLTTVSGPHEQLNLTNSNSDYMWYTTDLPEGVGSNATVQVKGGDYGFVYPTVDAAAGKLHVLSAAMGATNVGQILDVQKGLTGSVKVGGKDVTQQAWTQAWMMPGEAKEIYTPAGVDRVAWAPLTPEAEQAAHVWFRASFDMPAAAADEAKPAQTAFALDLKTMWKGQAYVNGFHLGRYYLVPGECSGACAPPVKNGHCYMHWKDCGKPTQTIYHIPTSVMKPAGNLVVLFEEAAPPAGTTRSLDGVELVQLHEHPGSD